MGLIHQREFTVGQDIITPIFGLMMKNNFLTASANIENLDPLAGSMPIITELKEDMKVNLALSNSFGFGGTNSVLAFRAIDN